MLYLMVGLGDGGAGEEGEGVGVGGGDTGFYLVVGGGGDHGSVVAGKTF